MSSFFPQVFDNYISDGLRKEYTHKGITVQVGMTTVTQYFSYYSGAFSTPECQALWGCYDHEWFYGEYLNSWSFEILQSCCGHYWYTRRYLWLLCSCSSSTFINCETSMFHFTVLHCVVGGLMCWRYFLGGMVLIFFYINF